MKATWLSERSTQDASRRPSWGRCTTQPMRSVGYVWDPGSPNSRGSGSEILSGHLRSSVLERSEIGTSGQQCGYSAKVASVHMLSMRSEGVSTVTRSTCHHLPSPCRTADDRTRTNHRLPPGTGLGVRRGRLLRGRISEDACTTMTARTPLPLPATRESPPFPGESAPCCAKRQRCSTCCGARKSESAVTTLGLS
jgi:hypothetical protein